MMGDIELENKRKQPRYALVSSVKYSLYRGPATDELDGQTLNVSSNGLCLQVRRSLEVGEEIVIVVSLVSILLRRYKVQWIRENPGDDVITYSVGLTSASNELSH